MVPAKQSPFVTYDAIVKRAAETTINCLIIFEKKKTSNTGLIRTYRLENIWYVYIMINSSKISIHRFIATTLFRVVKEWPHSSGNIHE